MLCTCICKFCSKTVGVFPHCSHMAVLHCVRSMKGPGQPFHYTALEKGRKINRTRQLLNCNYVRIQSDQSPSEKKRKVGCKNFKHRNVIHVLSTGDYTGMPHALCPSSCNCQFMLEYMDCVMECHPNLSLFRDFFLCLWSDVTNLCLNTRETHGMCFLWGLLGV